MAQFEELAVLLAGLDASDGGGGTLLDHTSVIYGTSLGNGNSHANDNLPVLLAGEDFATLNTSLWAAARTTRCPIYLSACCRNSVWRSTASPPAPARCGAGSLMTWTHGYSRDRQGLGHCRSRDRPGLRLPSPKTPPVSVTGALLWTILSILLALIPCLAASLGAAEQPPNIIVIMTDDMGFSDLGCFGGEIETPHLDHLASRGVRFTDFYNTSRCWPTRASLMTGQYVNQLRDEHQTIPERLRSVNYQTAMVGKWHLTGNPVEHGFENYYGTLGGAGSYWHPPRLTRNQPK